MIEGEKLLYDLLSKTKSTWVSRNSLLSYYQKNSGRIEDLDSLISHKKILHYEDENLYTLPYFARAENAVAENSLRLLLEKPSPSYSENRIRELIHDYEVSENEGKSLHIGQIKAVIATCNNNFVIITGGPGTGKTTVLSCAAYCLRALKEGTSISFTAPTGKAARRAAESTGENACTVHKKFGIDKEGNAKNGSFYEDVLVIDESSMNDIFLSAQILSKIPSGRRCVWVGDTDQLPSVGAGAVLRDLIASHVIPVAKLSKTFRQDNSSTLFTNIVNVREGKAKLIEGPDFHPVQHRDGSSDTEIVQTVIGAYKKGIEKYGIDNTCVLLPYRRNGVCSNKISNVLQSIANPNVRQGYRVYSKEDENTIWFKQGDLVMQLENRDECANGDVGKILQVSAAGVVADFLGEIVSYSPKELDQLALAYSMTVNKSQGSEYPYVVMVLLNQHEAMLNRNILYTGITRAKKECTVIYQETALQKAVQRRADENRKTLLAEKLIALWEKYKYVYNLA